MLVLVFVVAVVPELDEELLDVVNCWWKGCCLDEPVELVVLEELIVEFVLLVELLELVVLVVLTHVLRPQAIWLRRKGGGPKS